MKRLLIAFILLTVSVAAAWSQESPQATFSNRVHDFGVIKENGGPVSVEFEFTNTGKKPLLIVDATASCGCTRPEYPTNGETKSINLIIEGTVTPANKR